MNKKTLEKLKLERGAQRLEHIIRNHYGKKVYAEHIVKYVKKTENAREALYTSLADYGLEWDSDRKTWLSNRTAASWLVELADEHIEAFKLKWGAKDLEKIILKRFSKNVDPSRIIAYAEQSAKNRAKVYATLESYNFYWDAERYSWTEDLDIPAWIMEIVVDLFIEHEKDRQAYSKRKD